MGSYGWSGNVGIKDHGTAIILGTCVTDARFEPTEPESEEENFCDNCKLCVSVCIGQMFDKDGETSIKLGGVEFHHAKRRNLMRCNFSCGGFTGLASSGKWSTWPPGRFEIPDDETDLQKQMARAVGLYLQRPPMPGGYEHIAINGAKEYMTCENCQIMCWGYKKETAKNLKPLHNSGCVLQKPNPTCSYCPRTRPGKFLQKWTRTISGCTREKELQLKGVQTRFGTPWFDLVNYLIILHKSTGIN